MNQNMRKCRLIGEWHPLLSQEGTNAKLNREVIAPVRQAHESLNEVLGTWNTAWETHTCGPVRSWAPLDDSQTDQISKTKFFSLLHAIRLPTSTETSVNPLQKGMAPRESITGESENCKHPKHRTALLAISQECSHGQQQGHLCY